jgi:hypothetical protein
MKRIIYRMQVIFVLFLIVACNKNKTTLNTEINEVRETAEYSGARSSAFNSMRNVLHQADLDNLNWDEAEVVLGGMQQRTITITVFSRTNSAKKLVYLDAGDIKMYQWAGEVHVVPSN